MADNVQDPLDFLSTLPATIDQAERAEDAALKLWHIRLQNVLNLLNILCDLFIWERQGRFADTLYYLITEAQQLYDIIDSSLLTAREDHIQQVEYVLNQSIGRKQVTRGQIEDAFKLFRNWKLVALRLGISIKTLRRRRNELGMDISPTSGPHLTYTNICQQDFCHTICTILEDLPDAEETLVIGALRSRNIYVQRRRIRSGILEVDPVDRALRRMVSIVRRNYSVSSPQILWYVTSTCSSILLVKDLRSNGKPIFTIFLP